MGWVGRRRRRKRAKVRVGRIEFGLDLGGKSCECDRDFSSHSLSSCWRKKSLRKHVEAEEKETNKLTLAASASFFRFSSLEQALFAVLMFLTLFVKTVAGANLIMGATGFCWAVSFFRFFFLSFLRSKRIGWRNGDASKLTFSFLHSFQIAQCTQTLFLFESFFISHADRFLLFYCFFLGLPRGTLLHRSSLSFSLSLSRTSSSPPFLLLPFPSRSSVNSS